MLQKRLASAIATGALMLNLASPAFAASITVTGNGDSSNNTANVDIHQSQTVVQNNTANVNNTIDADANTGGNKANRNTGGDVSIDTGNATTNVSVNNTLNSNSAKIDCCPTNKNLTVNISGNGVDSDNDVNLNSTSNQGIFQDNNAYVYNKVDTDAKTGNNKANRNTGGDVTITTGDAETKVDVSTAANVNHAVIGGGNGNGKGGSLSAWIVGNGDSSDNDINVNLTANQTITQDNYADVYNKVDADAKTGNNKANRNTGGDISIDTGDATVDVSVNNWLNFNHADLDCGCLLDDWNLKIGGNGVDSDNDINLDLNDGKNNGVFQDNNARLDNKVRDLDANTGDNKVKRNTGESTDPSIETGNADVMVDVNNSLNVNTAGRSNTPEWDFPSGGVHWSFDLGDLLDWLASHLH